MKRRKFLGLLFLGCVLVFLYEAGWLQSRRTWQETSGWLKLKQQPPVLDLGGPELFWLGHSGFLIEWQGETIALDPNLSSSCPPVRRLFLQTAPQWSGSVETALISHAHYDHFDTATLAALPGLTRLIAPKGVDHFLPEKLKRQVLFVGLRQEETVQVGSLSVTALYTQHRGGRSHPLPSANEALGYLIDDGTRRLYYAGDSGYGDHFASIGALYKPDIAILPIGAFSPHFVLKKHHLSPEEAVQAAEDLGVSIVIPCHFGTFRMAFDSPDHALPRFEKAAAGASFQWFLPPLLGDPSNYDP